MKTSLNKLGLTTFQRKANKMRAILIDCTKEGIDLDHICTENEQVYVWNWEKAFSENLRCSGSELGSIITAMEFDCKIEFSHLGLYDTNLNSFLLYRLEVGEVSGWSYSKAFYEDQESKLIFLQQGQGSRL